MKVIEKTMFIRPPTSPHTNRDYPTSRLATASVSCRLQLHNQATVLEIECPIKEELQDNQQAILDHQGLLVLPVHMVLHHRGTLALPGNPHTMVLQVVARPHKWYRYLREEGRAQDP